MSTRKLVNLLMKIYAFAIVFIVSPITPGLELSAKLILEGS